MLLANGVRAGGGPYRFSGGAGALALERASAASPALALGFNTGEGTVVSGVSIANLNGIPSGTPRGWVMPVKGGAIKSYRRADVSISGAAVAELGYPASGSAVITVDASAVGGLIVGATGSATIAIDGQAAIVGTINGTGQATIALNAAAVLGAIASMTAQATLTIDGHAEIMGLGYMTGTTVESAELTPASIAAAVWNAMLASHQTAGSAGKALSTASTGGVDLNALAAAVVAALEATTIPVDVAKVNGSAIDGAGTEGDPWGPA